jgi:23S rRNA-/tRNA-specific pseudouridylate synthase
MHFLLYGVEYKTANNYLERLRVLHKSEHFLVVNKHEDLLFNSDERTDFRSVAHCTVPVVL